MTKRFKPYVIEGDMAMPLITDDGQRFNGRIITHPERLSAPLKRKKPTVYAIWNDWCHDAIDHVFRHKMVIGAEFSEQHTFLALTKRPHVMLDFWQSGIQHVPANWWNGLTVCNQEEADAKIPVFLKAPGKKFLSIEPMLGPVDFEEVPVGMSGPLRKTEPRIHAVILGGETGPGARPMHPDWVRSVRDQCQIAGVPFFFKSWGAWGMNWLNDPKDDFQKIPGSEWMDKGIKKPGRLLNGRTHDELPWVKP